MYSCHLFLISSISVRSLPFLSFIMPILVWNFPLISAVFSRHSLVFPVLLFFSIFSSLLLFSGTLHSVGYIFPFLPCFHFLSFLLFLKSLLKPLGLLGKPLCYTKAVIHEGQLCEWLYIRWNRGNDPGDVSLFFSASISYCCIHILLKKVDVVK